MPSAIDPNVITGAPVSKVSMREQLAIARDEITALQAVVGDGNTDNLKLPIGIIMPWTTNSAPLGWLLCNGQPISRLIHTALFGVIGTTYGSGNGVDTFNVPDLRGRTIIGRDDMGAGAADRVTAAASGIDALTLGASGGHQSLPAHTHSVAQLGTREVQNGTGATVLANLGSDCGCPITPLTVNTNSTGAGNAGNMPPSMVMNWIIYSSVGIIPDTRVVLQQLFVVGGAKALAGDESLAGGPFIIGVASQFRADLLGTKVFVHANPTATAVLSVRRDGAAVGTISISTSGVATLATTGSVAIPYTADQRFDCIGPTTPDATLKVSVTFSMELT